MEGGSGPLGVSRTPEASPNFCHKSFILLRPSRNNKPLLVVVSCVCSICSSKLYFLQSNFENFGFPPYADRKPPCFSRRPGILQRAASTFLSRQTSLRMTLSRQSPCILLRGGLMLFGVHHRRRPPPHGQKQEPRVGSGNNAAPQAHAPPWRVKNGVGHWGSCSFPLPSLFWQASP